jgi:hypothetical protein
MLYVQLVTCSKCPALVDLTHSIKHEVNPLLESVETKKIDTFSLPTTHEFIAGHQ